MISVYIESMSIYNMFNMFPIPVEYLLNLTYLRIQNHIQMKPANVAVLKCTFE